MANDPAVLVPFSLPKQHSSLHKQVETIIFQVFGAMNRSSLGRRFSPSLFCYVTDSDVRLQITDTVHAKGSFIFLQLWALGRAGNPNLLNEDGFPYISSSAVELNPKYGPPRELTVDEIQEYTQLYAQAAKNAVERAGFDGVEIHGANGYLVDQFTQDTCNRRTDRYGGSVENRSRFGLEVAKAVADAVGEERTGFRISPWSTFQGT